MTREIVLWPDGVPGSDHWTHAERTVNLPDGEQRVVNVTVPTLTPFLPDSSSANGTAMIVAPGGGYRMLSMESEGIWVAEWLRDRGVAAYVLKYRLMDTGTTDADLLRSFAEELSSGVEVADLAPDVRPLARADGEQAVRLVRGTGATVVGFMGFSAGGIVTCDVGTGDDPTARLDFIAPIYGAVAPDHLPAHAPPFFSMVCADDALCLDWCIDAFRAWRAADRPAELHVYGEGGHGFGLRKLGLPVDTWIDRLGDWMAANGWVRN